MKTASNCKGVKSCRKRSNPIVSAKDAVYTGLPYSESNLTCSGTSAPTYRYYADSNGTQSNQLDGAPINAGTYWVEVCTGNEQHGFRNLAKRFGFILKKRRCVFAL